MRQGFHSFPGTAAHTLRLPRTGRQRNPLGPAELRRWFGLSQEAFAEVLGISRSTVARWEASGTVPDTSTAEGRWLAVLVQIKTLAERLWRTPNRARAWLHSPLPVLRGERPLDVLKREGPMRVRDLLLDEIEGVYS